MHYARGWTMLELYMPMYREYLHIHCITEIGLSDSTNVLMVPVDVCFGASMKSLHVA